jgi:hypothetical protein
MLKSLFPFSIVQFTVSPVIDTFSLWKAVFKRPEVAVSFTESFIALAMSFIVEPGALILATVLIAHDAEALSFTVNYLAEVERPWEAFLSIFCALKQIFHHNQL